MNVERLHEAVKAILAIEDPVGLQHQLHQVRDLLGRLTDSPSDAGMQQAVHEQFGVARSMVEQILSKLSASHWAVLKEIGGERFYDHSVIRPLMDMMQDNRMTPAVVRDEARAIASARSQFVETLKSLANIFNSLGIRGEDLPPGTAELMVLLPRGIFDDDLAKLAKELKIVNDIIRPFSEAALGAPEKVRVDQISTSDPTFLFGLDLETIKLIGQGVVLILGVWKGLLELRKAKETSKTVGMPPQMLEWYEAKMKQTIDESLQKHADELTSRAERDAGRAHELNIALVKSMTKMAERMERGMKVEAA